MKAESCSVLYEMGLHLNMYLNMPIKNDWKTSLMQIPAISLDTCNENIVIIQLLRLFGHGIWNLNIHSKSQFPRIFSLGLSMLGSSYVPL